MNSVYQPEWRDQNSSRAYPFEDQAVRRSTDSLLELPDSWLVDAALYPLAGEGPYAIGTVTILGSGGQLTIVDRSGEQVGSGQFNRATGEPIGLYDGESAIGSLVVGHEANHPLFSAGDGVYQFGPGRADFIASTVMNLSDFSSLYGIRVGDQTINSSKLVLVGEFGVQLVTDETQDIQPDGTTKPVRRIRIHAIGDPQFLTRTCEDASRRPRRLIREVVFQYGDFTHVCRPTRGGVLMLAGSPSGSDTALQVQQRPGVINVRLRGKSL